MQTRFIVAIVGSLLLFGGVFVIFGIFVTPHMPDFLKSHVQIGAFGTDNAFGFIFGLIAAASSFVATLSMKK